MSIPKEMKRKIEEMVHYGSSPKEIASVGNNYVFDATPDYTATTGYLMEYFVTDALKHPKAYTNITIAENNIENEVHREAKKMDGNLLKEALVAEFWMFDDYIPYGIIAEVCKIVADASSVSRRRR